MKQIAKVNGGKYSYEVMNDNGVYKVYRKFWSYNKHGYGYQAKRQIAKCEAIHYALHIVADEIERNGE